MMEESKQPHPVDVVVGKRVREARIDKGLSQTALGERIGLTFQQVQKYENGANRVSASKLVEIADTLGLPPTHFLEGLGLAERGKTAAAATPVPGAQELMRLYADLPEGLRKTILQLARSLKEQAAAN